ncbi:MAG: hypothetical protein R6X25_10000 [Candidatus Krumholzibacteriia bacterium]
MTCTAARRLAGFCCVLLAVLLQAGLAATQEIGVDPGSGKVTVVLTSGEVYENVDLTVDGRFKIVRMRWPEGERQVSFSAVASIVEDGVDITRDVIDRRPTRRTTPAPQSGEAPPAGRNLPAADDGDHEAAPAGGTVWLSESDAAYRSARASEWPLALRLAGNYSFPFGDYYEGVESGIGYEGDALIAVSRKIAVRLSASRSGADFELDRFTSQDVAFDLSLAVWRFSAAAQVLAPLSRSGGGSFAHLYGGLGLAVHRLALDVTVNDPVPGVIYPESASDTETKFMTTFGGGLVSMLSSRVGVDLGAEVDMIWLGSENGDYGYYQTAQTAWLVDVKVGLVYFLK